MQARVAVRRAGRLAEAKLRRDPSTGGGLEDYYIEETPPVSTSERVIRRTLAVLMALLIPPLGAVFFLMAATSGGKGYQVAPVLTLMVAVLFGIPTVSILFRHVKAVWWETGPRD